MHIVKVTRSDTLVYKLKQIAKYSTLITLWVTWANFFMFRGILRLISVEVLFFFMNCDNPVKQRMAIWHLFFQLIYNVLVFSFPLLHDLTMCPKMWNVYCFLRIKKKNPLLCIETCVSTGTSGLIIPLKRG